MSDKFYRDALEGLSERGLARSLVEVASAQGPRILRGGRQVLCFCSNDYLGLANDPRVAAAAKEAIDRYGVGSGASRLISGSMSPHHRLEEALAAFKSAPAVLSFASGYQANLAALRAGAEEGDLICSDALNHASIVDACRLSRADVKVYPHQDLEALEAILKSAGGYRRRLIVTDSVFSVDGDLADLRALVDLKHRYKAALCVDEAHATGVFGEHGRGTAELQGVEEHIDISVGTLSKAIGVMGGFVAGSRPLIDYMISTARSFIYTTAPPPAVAAAALAALGIVQAEPERRTTLLAHAARVRGGLLPVLTRAGRPGPSLAGANSEDAGCPIVPVVVGESRAAVALADQLLDQGVFVSAIRPPTVPEGTARLRITVTAAHTQEDIGVLLGAIGQMTSGGAS